MALTNPQETIDERPTCVAYAGGRVFYAMKNSVYFSQVMEGESIDFLNRCYQKNDPTAEQISDLLSTDGGVLQINEAVNIIQLMALGNGVIIYAQNGVWHLSGPDTGFTATNFFRELVTEAGCVSPQSVVKVEDVHYFWSSEGIFQIGLNQFGKVRATNTLDNVLQTFYNKIPLLSKSKSAGSYNRIKKQIEWFYSSSEQTGATEYKYAHDKSLLLDLRAGGFWPQQYNSILDENEWVEEVTNFVVSGVNTNLATEDDEVRYLTIQLSVPTVAQNYDIGFYSKTASDFKEGRISNTTAYPTAYIETGYETLNKPSNAKSAPYISTHFLQTEENWIADGSGGLELDTQSGCQMRAKWDWNDSSANGRWSPAQQAYRFGRVFTPPSVAGPYDSGERVISTKNKVLGRGKSLSLRFEQEEGKDLQLLGYTTQWSIKSRM